MFGYEKLIIYQQSKELVIDIYKLTQKMPDSERFGLISQINRAAISVPSNIAEGCGRNGVKEKVHFIAIAYGSLMELSCQLEIASDLEFITKESYIDIKPKMEKLSIMMSKYRAGIEKVT